MPKLCSTLETLVYPFDPQYTLEPIGGFVWSKLTSLHLPPMFEGEETNKYLLSIPSECPNLKELEIKIEEFNASFPIDEIITKSDITSLTLRFGRNRVDDDSQRETMVPKKPVPITALTYSKLKELVLVSCNDLRMLEWINMSELFETGQNLEKFHICACQWFRKEVTVGPIKVNKL